MDVFNSLLSLWLCVSSLAGRGDATLLSVRFSLSTGPVRPAPSSFVFRHLPIYPLPALRDLYLFTSSLPNLSVGL